MFILQGGTIPLNDVATVMGFKDKEFNKYGRDQLIQRYGKPDSIRKSKSKSGSLELWGPLAVEFDNEGFCNGQAGVKGWWVIVSQIEKQPPLTLDDLRNVGLRFTHDAGGVIGSLAEQGLHGLDNPGETIRQCGTLCLQEYLSACPDDTEVLETIRKASGGTSSGHE